VALSNHSATHILCYWIIYQSELHHYYLIKSLQTEVSSKPLY